MNNTKQKRSRANQMQDSFHYEGKKKEIDAMLGSIRLQHIMDLVNILEYVS